MFRTCKIFKHFRQPENLVNLSTCLGVSNADELVMQCQDISKVDVSNSETASYSHVLLDWVKNWDQETRDRVLLERMLQRRGQCRKSCQVLVSSVFQARVEQLSLVGCTDLGTNKGEHIQAATLWSYLTSHQDVAHLKEWVESQYGTSRSSAQPSWPFHLPLEPALLKGLDDTTDFVKEELLNMLAR